MQEVWRGAWVAMFAAAMLPVAVGTVWEERLFDQQPDIDIAVVCFWPTLYSLILSDVWCLSVPDDAIQVGAEHSGADGARAGRVHVARDTHTAVKCAAVLCWCAAAAVWV